MTRRYGVNVVSLFPHCFGATGLDNSLLIATSAGFDGIQALPMKGWQYPTHSPEGVMSYEDAWNYGSVLDVLRRLAGRPGAKNPTFIDLLLFGRERFPAYDGPIYIKHSASPASVLEIHPGFSNQSKDYHSLYGEGIRFCWDTFHIRRNIGFGWEYFMRTLPDDSVKIIHAHITTNELESFLQGVHFDLTEMLVRLAHKFPDAPVILEFFPGILPRARVDLVLYLNCLLARLKTYMS